MSKSSTERDQPVEEGNPPSPEPAPEPEPSPGPSPAPNPTGDVQKIQIVDAPREDYVKTPSPGLDVGQAEVQARMDAATEKGYIGGTPDPTPNENYSLETPDDAPTPETDPDLAAKADQAVRGNRLLQGGLSTAQTEKVYQEA